MEREVRRQPAAIRSGYCRSITSRFSRLRLTEHPILVDLAQRNIVPIHGLNYKDAPDDAASWLKRWGNPYTRTGADVSGLVGIDWGVYGVPETFVVGADGRIAYKHIGPLTAEFVRDKLLPMIDGLRQ